LAGSGQIKAGEAFVELFAKDGRLQKGLKEAERKISDWSVKVSKIGKALFSGSLINAGFAVAVRDATKLGGELVDLSAKSGLSVERLSQLRYAATLAGVSLEELVDHVTKHPEDAGVFADFEKEAAALGYTLSREDALAATTFSRHLKAVWEVLQTGAAVIGSALMPELIRLANYMTEAAQIAAAWIRSHRDVFRVAAAAGVALAGAAISVLALGKAIGSASFLFRELRLGMLASDTALAAVKVALLALVSPAGLVLASVAGIGLLFVRSTQRMANAANTLRDIWAIVKEDALTTFEGIRNSLASGDWQLAAQILWKTLELEWARGATALKKQWVTLWHAFQLPGIEAVAALEKLFVRFGAKIQEIGERIRYFFKGIPLRMEIARRKMEIDAGIGEALLDVRNRELKGSISHETAAKARALLEEERGRRHTEVDDELRRPFERARQAELNRIAKVRDEEIKAIDNALKGQLADLEKAAEDQRHKIGAEIEILKKQRKALLDAAAAERKKPRAIPEIDARIEQLDNLLHAPEIKAAAHDVIRGGMGEEVKWLGGFGPQARMEQNTKKIASNTAKANDQLAALLRKGGVLAVGFM
jgi:hypothetical protein